jgi:hypothetical protein
VRIMDDVVSVFKGSLELWPALIEICYFQKGRKGLPQIRVNNGMVLTWISIKVIDVCLNAWR